MEEMRILFICKIRQGYGFQVNGKKSSGLFNSTQFIVRSLQDRGVHAKIVEVVDNNSIDREVAEFKPHLVVIEALWVVPEKFEVLKRLHPEVDWFVHLHSNMPFLALEGNAFEWIAGYVQREVGILCNSQEAFEAVSALVDDRYVGYLPNVYISDPRKPQFYDTKECVDIGCFGAIRPLKNHVTQAVAAIRFAKAANRTLRFHINATRVEGHGQPVLKNLRKLFDSQSGAELVEHGWYEPSEFLKVLEELDMGMQVSLSETFNVVTADYVTAGLPVVVSDEVRWVHDSCKAKPDSITSIVETMEFVWRKTSLIRKNQNLLIQYSLRAQEAWYEFVRKDHC